MSSSWQATQLHHQASRIPSVLTLPTFSLPRNASDSPFQFQDADPHPPLQPLRTTPAQVTSPAAKNVQSILRILQFSANNLSCSAGCLRTERTCSQDLERGNPETAKQAGQEGSTYQHHLLPAFPFIRAFKCGEEEVGARENRGPVFGYTSIGVAVGASSSSIEGKPRIPFSCNGA